MLIHHWKHIRQLSNGTLSVLICMTAMVIIEGILWYLVPNYFDATFGIEHAGIALSAYGLGSLMSSLPAADLTDTIGKKFMFFSGMTLFVISLLLLHVPFLPAAILFMLILGISSACIDIGCFNYVLEHIPKQSTGKANGLYNTFRGIGWCLGSIGGGLLIAYLPFTVNITILSIIAMCILWHFYRKETQAPLSGTAIKKSLRVLLQDKVYFMEFERIKHLGWPIALYSVFSLVYGFYEYGVMIAEPLYTSSIGTNIILAGFLLSITSLPRLLFSTPIGKIVDRFGGRVSMLMGISLGIIGHSYFLFFSNHDLLSLALSFLLIAVSEICLLLPFQSHIHLHVQKHTQAQAHCIGDSLFSIGGIIAPFIIAFTLGNSLNFHYFLSITGVSYLAVWLSLIVLMLKDKHIFQNPHFAVVDIKS